MMSSGNVGSGLTVALGPMARVSPVSYTWVRLGLSAVKSGYGSDVVVSGSPYREGFCFRRIVRDCSVRLNSATVREAFAGRKKFSVGLSDSSLPSQRASLSIFA
jgi:hypothetical protein